VERRGPAGSYWVVPGRLLAGMYPDVETIQELRAAGVDTFFDLTEDGELDRYDLDGLEHRRFPIRDMSTPSPQQMAEILDALDAALDKEKTVYLHCLGGIGRTGTVVGCHLVRTGRTGQEALADIVAWRGDRWSPQTEAQKDFVRAWRESG
jgi:polymorphic toxin system DSP-PTPase phosphatase-like protein